MAAGSRLHRHGDLLKVLLKSSPKLRRAIIGAADKDLIDCLCECSMNILRGNVVLTANQRDKLRRHKKALRKMANKRLAAKPKREILQRGGFLGMLLAPLAASVLGPVVSSLFK